MLMFAMALLASGSPAENFAPLDFLVGHCWRGDLPTKDADTHCFTRVGDEVRDHHDVQRDGKSVYSGDTVYRWDSATGMIQYVYTSVTGGVMKGAVKGIDGRLDFGESVFVGKSGKKATIKTQWARAGAAAYDVNDVSPDVPELTRTTRYVRVD